MPRRKTADLSGIQPFRGRPGDDGRKWLRRFDREQREVNASPKDWLLDFDMLMEEQAAWWSEVALRRFLGDDVVDDASEATVEHVSSCFRARYPPTPPPENFAKSLGEVDTSPQGLLESFDDYYERFAVNAARTRYEARPCLQFGLRERLASDPPRALARACELAKDYRNVIEAEEAEETARPRGRYPSAA